MTIGEIILKNRKKAGISQEELADAVGVSRQSISLWETDQTLPTTANLVKLTEIFRIGMDELCGREARAEEVEKKPLAETSVAFTKSLLRNFYVASVFVRSIVFLVVAAVMLIALLAASLSGDADMPIVAAVALAVALLGLGILAVRGKLYVDRQIKQNCVGTVRFYADRIEYGVVSASAHASYVKGYSEIKRIRYFRDDIFLFFDGVTVPLVKADLQDSRDTVCALLHIPPEEMTGKRRGRVRAWLAASLALSVASLFLAMFVTGAVFVGTSPLPQFSASFAEYLWIFYVFLPLPLASLITGAVCLRKKYRCKKNIVAGAIVCALLAIYGSFTPMIGSRIGHDFEAVREIAAELPVDLPDRGVVSYMRGDGRFEAAIGCDEDFSDTVRAGGWIDAFSSVPNFVPLAFSAKTQDCDWFYLYDTVCAAGNSEIAGSHEGHAFIFLAYSEENGVLWLFCFSA